MDRTAVLHTVSEVIERLAKLHILYRLEGTDMFQKQKEHLNALVSDYKTNVKAELDPITQNLYRRYLG